MIDLTQQYQEFSLLSELARADLNTFLRIKTVGKGEVILQDGDVCRNLYFLSAGLIKVYSFKFGKEFIMRFFCGGEIFTAFDSFLTRTPSKFTIIALEDTIVHLISLDHIELLCKKHHTMETFFRQITAETTVRMTKRIHEMLEEDSAKRYEKFMEENKAIYQRISLGDLARYLGITQQSLSRIRGQKK